MLASALSLGAWDLAQADPVITGVVVAVFACSGLGYVIYRVVRGRRKP